MREPIIVVEGNTVHCLQSVERAQTYMEPVDVENGEYIAFDASGSRLTLRTEWVTKPARFLWFSWLSEREIVVIEESDPPVDSAHELRNILVDTLQRHGFSHDILSESSLEELIQNIADIYC